MDLILDPGMKPFLFFAALVVGLLILEIIFMFIGIDTRLGGDADADMDFDLDVDADTDFDMDVDADAGIADADGPGNEVAAGVDADGGGLFDLIGIRKLPMTVWLALFSALFAGVGLAGQTLVATVIGTMLPAGLAVVMALPVALVMTGYFSEAVSNWIPREESTAISERSYGRRKGVVTVGTSKRGSPAQVRFSDHHGNLHFLMAEPMSDDEEIGQGTEVLVIRQRDGAFRLIPASD